MAKNLLIVESPAKAKTIEKILGPDFEVRSCFGHIRDLEKSEMGIDIANKFIPRYKISDDKTKVVKDLKAAAKGGTEVWLASDEDREGEAISWHLAEVLGLDPATTKRIVFHEITKPAIEKAVKNPRLINMNLVNAQQARRVVDRIVGFELSPVLWRKIGMSGGLSAGRVQSVAVRVIAEREREINQFVVQSHFKITSTLSATENGRAINFKAEAPKQTEASGAQAFLEACKGATYTVKDLTVRPAKKTPAAPFTTSTLQQEASRKLGYGVSKTMLLAQKLYESGKITYMRTDSVNLSETALESISGTIKNNYGAQYSYPRKYKNKNESAQEAHEAIRPTYMENSSVADPDLNRLYELIWKRTMASQMADAELENTTVKIAIKTTDANSVANNSELTASGQVIKFDGFLKVYLESTDEETEDSDDEKEGEGRLPALQIGQVVNHVLTTATERFSRPPARYTEAALVKKLEELGIGRPSTYAPTISTIIKRNYVEKREAFGTLRSYQKLILKNDAVSKTLEQETTGADKGKLMPTDLGLVVTDFLKQHFEKVMDYQFTAKIEQEFDEIASGKIVWNNMVQDFYTPFHETVTNTMETANRAVGERELGHDAESGKVIIARMGRFGPMVQIGKQDDEEKPKFAKLKNTQSIETITLEEALDLFKLAEGLGQYEGADVSVNIGRFGPYVKWGDQFISIPRGEDANTVDLQRAIEIIAAKQIEDAPIATYNNLPVTKGKGRFGPFIKWNDMFINIPVAYKWDTLTQQDCNELIEKKIEKEANRVIKHFAEDKITIENARWGAIIKYNKKTYKMQGGGASGKYTPEEIKELDVEVFKAMIIAQDPKAFAKKAVKKAAVKKAGTAIKTAAAKKPAVKKVKSVSRK
jgi:DNA topoisomerase I